MTTPFNIEVSKLPKLLQGKYAVAPNTYVECQVSNPSLGDNGFEIEVSLRTPGDVTLQAGTQIFLDLSNLFEQQDNHFPIFFVNVLSMETRGDKYTHICTPIQQSSRNNTRKFRRRNALFPAIVKNGETKVDDFTVIDACETGLTLCKQSRTLFSGVCVAQNFNVEVDCNGETLTLQSTVKHIHYNITQKTHYVGVSYARLPKKQLITFMTKVDPNYEPPEDLGIATEVSETKISGKL